MINNFKLCFYQLFKLINKIRFIYNLIFKILITFILFIIYFILLELYFILEYNLKLYFIGAP